MRDSRVLKDQMLDPVGDDALRRIESRLMRSLDARSVQETSRRTLGTKLGVGAAVLSLAAALLWWVGLTDDVNDEQASAPQMRTEQALSEQTQREKPSVSYATTPDTLGHKAPAEPSPSLQFASGEAVAPGAMTFARPRIEFRDGAAVVAQEKSALHVKESDGEQTTFEIEAGQVLFDVPARSIQTWTIVTPLFSVQAGAARFVVERRAGRASVVVEGGEATVKTPDGKSLRLVAGDSYVAPEVKESARFVTQRPAEEDAESETRQVRFEDVDRARARGDITGAMAHLRELAANGSVHQRSLAQFTMGKLLHEQGDVNGAREALRRARSLAGSGPLAGAIERRLERLDAISAQRP